MTDQRIELDDGLTGEQVARRILFLAYEASVPMGIGIMTEQFGGKATSEHELWMSQPANSSDLVADYVNGRMVKLWGVQYGKDWISSRDIEPRPDYQSWCKTYPTYEALVTAAIDSIKEKVE